MNDIIFDYDELKIKLLEFSKYKIIDDVDKNIKLLNIQRKLNNYKKNSTTKVKKYIKVFLLSDNKVIKQYDERLDKTNLNFLDEYLNEKTNMRIIVYFFDTSTSKSKYLLFMSKCENTQFLINIKNIFSKYFKYFLALNTFTGIFFSIFILFALPELGIPIKEVVDFPLIALLLMSSILFLSILLLVIFILIPILVIPLLVYNITEYNDSNIYLALVVISTLILLIIIPLYFRKYKPHLLSKMPISFAKYIYYSTLIVSLVYLISFYMMFQSIISSLFPSYIFYDKSGYSLAMEQYIKRFSGYPKIVKKNGKDYYTPVVSADYYYVYNINKSKKLYFNYLKEKSKLDSICKNDKTKIKFRNNYIVNNPYIKPRFNIEKISIDDIDVKIKPLKLEILIKKEEIDDLCKNNS